MSLTTPLTLRYNNPGAVEFKPWMSAYGATLGPNGRYAQFGSPDQGYQVMSRILDTYQNKHGLNTVGGIVNRWAPPQVDNNSTSQYAASVAKRLGVDPNAPLTPEQRPGLMQAMAAYEAGRAPAPLGASPPQQPPQATIAPGAAPMPLNDAQPQGFDLNQWATSPLFMMGAGVLGGQNIGQGLMQGVQASNQARTGQLRNTLLQQQMDAKRRQQSAWDGMFAGGQPNMSHPLLKDLPPDMIGLAQAMGPDAGLSALHDYSMKRHGSLLARQAEMEKIRAVKQLEQEMAAESRKRMTEALGPLFGQSSAPAPSVPQPAAPQQGMPTIPVPGVQRVPQQSPQPAQPVARPSGGLAIQPAAPAFTPDMARLAQARIALGDTKGALEIYEKALENAQVPGREAEKTIAVERAKAVAGDEKSSKAARDMWALLDQMDRGTAALGDGRLDAAANPDFDTWFGRNVSRRFSQEAYNDRLKLKTMANSMVLQARETQRGLGQLTEGEQRTLEEAYTTMMSANNADEFKNAVSTVRMVLAAKIPEQSGYVAPWISKLEEERERRSSSSQAAPQQNRRDLVPPKGNTNSVDTLGPELEGKDVYDSKTGQWGRVLNGEFVSRRAMMQGEAKRRLLQQQVN